MMKTVCRHCGKQTSVKRNISLKKLKCKHCKNDPIRTVGRLTGNGYFLCDCGSVLSPESKFGWTIINCPSCGSQTKHPALTHQGGLPDRGVKYPEMLTIKCSAETKTAIKALVKKFQTTQGAVTRHLLNISLDHLV